LRKTNPSLYSRFLHCWLKKHSSEPFDALAKEANSTPKSVVRYLYRIDRGDRTPTSKRIIEAIIRLCPKGGFAKLRS